MFTRTVSQFTLRVLAAVTLAVLMALLVGFVLPDNQITFTYYPDDEHTAVALLDMESGFLFDLYRRERQSVDFLSWSPDGSRLMFLSNPGLLAFDLTQSHLRTVARGYNMFPIWSPDGSQVAFVRVDSDRFGYNRSAHIYVADSACAELCEPRSLTHNINPFNYAPSWSPDSQQIVFFSSASPRSGEVIIMDVATGDTRRLGLADPDLLFPVWSPDGERIAVFSMYDGLKIMDTASGRELYSVPDGRMLAWSPDGAQIAYVTGFDVDYKLPLYVREADGGNPRLIAHTSSGAPSWSPDGQHLAFLMFVGTNREIFVANALDGALRRLTDNLIYEYNFAWRPHF